MNFFYYIFSIFIFLLGLSIGSFINALVYRLYSKESLRGRSKCVKCKKELRVIDLVPVFSFLFLKGRCHYCNEKISWQYPLVEFMTGVIFLLIYFKFIITYDFIDCNLLLIIDLSLLLLYSVILITIFVYDLKYYIIPDKILFSGIILGIFAVVFKSFYNWSIELVIAHTFSVFLVFGFFLFLYLISKGQWIGEGDVKFGILLGLIIPWPESLVMMFFSYVLGAIVGIILLLLKKKKLKEKVPLGTFLVIGTFITIFIGKAVLKWYLELIL